MKKTELRKCVRELGGYQAIGTAMGVTKQLVWSWVNVSKQIPPQWVTLFSEVTGIPRYKIRPDIFPKHRELIT